MPKTVTNTNDSGAGSLRQAILDAESGEFITFQLPASNPTILLTSGEIKIDKNLTILGSSENITISGNNNSRIFHIQTDVTVTARRIFMTEGLQAGGGAIFNSGIMTLVDSNFFGNSASEEGGAIYNRGTLTLINCTLYGNSAIEVGGAIYNLGTITIAKSTLSNNSASSGGAMLSYNPVNITNSTLSNNTASFWGGAIYNVDQMNITNSTLSGNSASGVGAAIYNEHGELSISFSTIANHHSGNGAHILNDTDASIAIKNTLIANAGANYAGSGPFTAFGVNYASDGTCPGCTEVNATDLKLGPLAENPPGTMQTHALGEASVAIDKATDCRDLNGNPVTTDQRGVPRPQLTACDVGAYEFYVEPPVKVIPLVIAQPLVTHHIKPC